MTAYRRNFVPGGCFFFTVNLADRQQRLLTENVEALRDAVREVRQRHPFTIEAMVVLPDHLHAVWTMPENDRDFATRWRLVKSTFSRSFVADEPIRSVALPRESEASGSGAIGSTRFETKANLRATSTIFISIRSNMAMWLGCEIGRILRFIAW